MSAFNVVLVDDIAVDEVIATADVSEVVNVVRVADVTVDNVVLLLM